MDVFSVDCTSHNTFIKCVKLVISNEKEGVTVFSLNFSSVGKGPFTAGKAKKKCVP